MLTHILPRTHSYKHTLAFLYSATPTNNKSFYRRHLPPHLISLNSHEGKKIFAESLEEGNSQAFFSLVQQFVTQGDPSTCASASMAMVLNALRVDPKLNWKGIWRWYDDYNIKQMENTKLTQGLTLLQFHQLIQLNHTKSMVFSPFTHSSPSPFTHSSPSPFTHSSPSSHHQIKTSTLKLFRNTVLSCNRRSNMFLTVNFHRKSMQQTGTGHYSPIAAYNSKRDLVLVLDVAKFKYDSYWCSLEYLYDALKPIDTVSSMSRGFLINKKRYEWEGQAQSDSAFCSLEMDMQLNSRLKERIEESCCKLQFMVVSILNDEKMHPLLIPMLFELHSLQAGRTQQMLTKLGVDQNIEPFSIFMVQKQLNDQANHLLSAFSKHQKTELITFLFLVLRVTINCTQVYRQIYNTGSGHLFILLKLIRKCQLYLQINEQSFPQLYSYEFS